MIYCLTVPGPIATNTARNFPTVRPKYLLQSPQALLETVLRYSSKKLFYVPQISQWLLKLPGLFV